MNYRELSETLLALLGGIAGAMCIANSAMQLLAKYNDAQILLPITGRIPASTLSGPRSPGVTARKRRLSRTQGRDQRTAGSICIANEDCLRYKGELEIAGTDLPADPRVNVIGHIAAEDRSYLPFIRNGMGFCLVRAEKGVDLSGL